MLSRLPGVMFAMLVAYTTLVVAAAYLWSAYAVDAAVAPVREQVRTAQDQLAKARRDCFDTLHRSTELNEQAIQTLQMAGDRLDDCRANLRFCVQARGGM